MRFIFVYTPFYLNYFNYILVDFTYKILYNDYGNSSVGVSTC